MHHYAAAGAGQLHIGDVIFQLVSIGFLFLIIFGAVYLFVTINKRSKERLELQRQQVQDNTLLQEELTELKARVAKIEHLLKEVE